jgi:hypothetical protein
MNMNQSEPAHFDLDTVSLLRKSLEDAWASLRPDQQAYVSRTVLAERILKCAAQGERDSQRLIEAALLDLDAQQASASL